jgi:hypothetical protein
MKSKSINSINDLKKFFIKAPENFYSAYSKDNEALCNFYRNYPLGGGTLLELAKKAEISGKNGFFADLVDGKFQEAPPRYSYTLFRKLTEEEFKKVFKRR